MEIIIIDSGVYAGHPALKNECIYGYGLKYSAESQNCFRVDDFEDNIGHGTAVFHLIRKGCKEADIKNIKIFNSNFDLSEEALCSALEYIYEHENPKIINLSLGLTMCEDENRLYRVCKKFHDKGVLIISAFDNGGAISFPAAFDCVYGVNGMPQISKEDEMWMVKDSYVNICAKGTVSRLMWRNPDYVYLSGNSFSCAIATANIASGIFHKTIDDKFYEIGAEKKTVLKKPGFKIYKAVIFPLNKEIHSLLRFQANLPFEIVGVYDHKLTGRVGGHTNKIVKCDEAKDFIVRNITDIDWTGVDTLILGHTDQLMNLTHDETMIQGLFLSAKENSINIYSFDPCEKNDRIFYPEVNEDDLPDNHFGKLFKINKPVLGIVGTSSRQGKFSLQLALASILKEKGYSVGCLGTEPSALLFGMDAVFPYGYNSTVSLKESEAILYINRLMREISLTNCEIILTGAQSAELSGELNSLYQFTANQQAYLYGTLPDAIVLVVSAHDTIEYIQRTISFVESICDCNVLAIGFLPRYIVGNDWGVYEKYLEMKEKEIVQYKEYIRSKFNIEAFVIGRREDESLLADRILEFF